MPKKTPSARVVPEVEIADPLGDLRTAITKQTEAVRQEAAKANEAISESLGQLKTTLTKSIRNQEHITTLVIIVMAIGFLVLLFSLAAVLIVSFQANQTVQNAVQLQLNSIKAGKS